jgi:hypothetical protein
MKRIQLRWPAALLVHSALSVKSCLKPKPQPALSVTVKLLTRTTLTFGWAAEVEASKRIARQPGIIRKCFLTSKD